MAYQRIYINSVLLGLNLSELYNNLYVLRANLFAKCFNRETHATFCISIKKNIDLVCGPSFTLSSLVQH